MLEYQARGYYTMLWVLQYKCKDIEVIPYPYKYTKHWILSMLWIVQNNARKQTI
jgi:hypothetical protein